MKRRNTWFRIRDDILFSKWELYYKENLVAMLFFPLTRLIRINSNSEYIYHRWAKKRTEELDHMVRFVDGIASDYERNLLTESPEIYAIDNVFSIKWNQDDHREDYSYSLKFLIRYDSDMPEGQRFSIN